MNSNFPAAVPEIPVSNIDIAAAYYKNHLGFNIDWGDDQGGIAGISKGDCRLFLTNESFYKHYGNKGPVLIWLNLDSIEQVDALHSAWKTSEAIIVSGPASKPWGLHEFMVADLDGNLVRVFYDFATRDEV